MALATFNWREFLDRLNRDSLEEAKGREHIENLPAEVIASKWLGRPGATEADIESAEERLKAKLPPSYRHFLKVSNGWSRVNMLLRGIYSTEEIGWLRDKNRELMEAWIRGGPDMEEVPDEVYFVYGDGQDCIHIRPFYLRWCLQISEVYDGAVLLLNPEVVTEHGEWEAWLLASWLPGAHRYRSFRALMKAQYQQLLSLP